MVTEGDNQTVADLVSFSEALGNLVVWQIGTPYLTQLHDDLGALLDAQLTAFGDASTISPAIDSQIVARFDPGFGAGRAARLRAGDLARPRARGCLRRQQPGELQSGDQLVCEHIQHRLRQRRRERGGAGASLRATGVQNYLLGVVPVPGSRGGVDYFGADGDQVRSLTAALRNGVTQFVLSFGDPAPVGSPQPHSSPVPPPTPQPQPPSSSDVPIPAGRSGGYRRRSFQVRRSR